LDFEIDLTLDIGNLKLKSRKKNMFFKLRKNKIIDNRGGALIFALIFGTISFSLVVMGISGYALYQNKLAMSKHAREMAFQIADAGVAYYRWHIFANENDYQDGTATTGPYIHDYFDKNKNNIGKFSLELTAPRTGSTVSTIKSTGWLNAYSGAKRTIKARVGKPSLTDYSFLTNSEIWIGPDEVVHGRMHSNGAVRFDGETDSLVSSQLLGYYCPSTQPLCHGSPHKGGVWGAGGPSVFFVYPAGFKDFDLVNNKLDEIRTNAINSGIYLDDSPNRGWHIIFSTTTQNEQVVMQVKVYNVSLCEGDGCSSNWRSSNYCDNYKCRNCYNTDHKKPGATACCLDISSETLYLTTTTPEMAYIYSEADVWVEGVSKGSVIVGSNKDIIIKSNLVYAERVEENILGLTAKENVLIPYKVSSTLEIHASMIAQTGAIQRYDYYQGASPYLILDTIRVNGSIISFKIWTFTWVDNQMRLVSGFANTETTFNVYSLFNPPPSSPVGANHVLIEWQEIK